MVDPHGDQAVLHAGCGVCEASRVLILLHGRGASARSILALGQELGDPQTALVAPQAADGTWYPRSFLAPLAENEPYLSSALAKVKAQVDACEAAGVSSERIVIVGFSQGACLAAEFVARHPARYGGLLSFTGGLIGAEDADVQHEGQLAGTPILLSSSDPDPHVPFQRVADTAQVFEQMGGHVVLLRHRGRPHTIVPEEIDAARTLLRDAHV